MIMVMQVSSCVAFQEFIVLHFTFSSLIHFELIFVKGMRSLCEFIVFHVASSCFSAIC